MRTGRGVRKLEGVASLAHGIILGWLPSNPAEVWHCSHTPSARLSLEALFGEQWKEMAFVQFLCMVQETAEALRRGNADVPNFGGNYGA